MQSLADIPSFKSLAEMQAKNPEFDIDQFTKIKANHTGPGRKGTISLVTIAPTGISFNNHLVIRKKVVEKWVDVFFDFDRGNALLMFMFRKENTGDSFKVGLTENTIKKGQGARFGATSVIKTLAKTTDVINVQAYRYRFKPVLIDENNHRIVIDLSEPYSKIKIKRRK